MTKNIYRMICICSEGICPSEERLFEAGNYLDADEVAKKKLQRPECEHGRMLVASIKLEIKAPKTEK